MASHEEDVADTDRKFRQSSRLSTFSGIKSGRTIIPHAPHIHRNGEGVLTRLQKRKAEKLADICLPKLPNDQILKRERTTSDTEFDSGQTLAFSSDTPATGISIATGNCSKSLNFCSLCSQSISSSSRSESDTQFCILHSQTRLQDNGRPSLANGDVEADIVSCNENLDLEYAEMDACNASKTDFSSITTDWSKIMPVAMVKNSCASYSVDKGAIRAQITSSQYKIQHSQATKPCNVYASEFHAHLLSRESGCRKPWNILKHQQKELEAHHRKIMVNWLVEFAEEFDLQLETLFLGVGILDAYLCKGPIVKRNRLQLLGMASIMIATKFQETKPPRLLKDCCEVAEKSFSQEEVIGMETEILKQLHFDVSVPTPLSFISLYLKAANADLAVEQLAQFLATLSLLDYDCLKFKPSVVSGASLLLSLHTLDRQPWTADLESISGYTPPCLQECVERIHFLYRQLHSRRRNEPHAISLKLVKTNLLQFPMARAKEFLPACLYTNLTLL